MPVKRLPSTPEQIEAALATCPYLDIAPWHLVSTITDMDLDDDWAATIPVHVLLEAMIADRVQRHEVATRLHTELREVKAENDRLRDAARTLCSTVDVARLFEVET